jgi:hypothetical protein
MRKNKNNKRPVPCCKIHEETETLFRFAPPHQLRKSVTEVYAIYLQNIESMDFKEVAMDMYFLNKFLEKAEESGLS